MGRVVIMDTVCFKNFDEIALSCSVKETETIWCFAVFVTNLKIDNNPHFWERQIFFGKLDQLLSSSYPVGQKFRRNRSI